MDVTRVSSSHCFVLGVLLALHGGGSLPGLEGGFCLSKQSYRAWSGVVAGNGIISFSLAPGLAFLAVGDDLGVTRSSVTLCRDGCEPWTSGVAVAIRFAVCEFASPDRGPAPMASVGCPLAATAFCFALTGFHFLYPDL